MMSEELGQGGAETGKGPSGGPGGNAAGSDRGIQAARSALRRRMLLRGLVAAPAALAVMRPVKTLAKAKKVCSYSGWHSFKMNAQSSASPKTGCKLGYNSKFYYSKYRSKLPKKGKKKGWGEHKTSRYSIPNIKKVSTPLYQSTTFAQLFGGKTKGSPTLLSCFESGKSKQGTYLTALFNAYYLNRSGYPYTWQQIYDIYKDPQKLDPDGSHQHLYLTQSDVVQYFQQLDSFG